MRRCDFRRRDNPWELLVICALFFFPGVFMLIHHGAMMAIQQGYLSPGGITVISEHGAHIFGGSAIAVGVALFWLYFYVRRPVSSAWIVFWLMASVIVAHIIASIMFWWLPAPPYHV
jgi:hypothetical protein